MLKELYFEKRQILLKNFKSLYLSLSVTAA